jgi:hypothetical protein
MPTSFSLPALEAWQWAALCAAAFCTGLSKTGISGLGIISVVLFPQLLPARESVGSVLMLLIGSDAVAVLVYRRDAEWHHLWRLFPWAGVGICLGFLAMRHINDTQAKHLIGAILFCLAAFQLWQRVRESKERKASNGDEETAAAAPHLALCILTGMLAGFTTMVANAAGPIMVLYLLAMRLPKVAFVGTAAWYFMILNWVKVPFGVALGTITLHSLALALALYPAAFAGCLVGRPLVSRIPQKTFELLALILTLLGSLNLLRA